jgi:hypothetical protein
MRKHLCVIHGAPFPHTPTIAGRSGVVLCVNPTGDPVRMRHCQHLLFIAGGRDGTGPLWSVPRCEYLVLSASRLRLFLVQFEDHGLLLPLSNALPLIM